MERQKGKDQSPRSNLFFVWCQEGRSLFMSIYPCGRDSCKSYWKATFTLRRVWNDLLGIGHPASHHSVKQYLVLIREEQARARITPKQAVPLFFDKLLRLCSFLKESIFAPQILPLQRYIYARDPAFFSLEFFAGDRASDLGRVFTK